MKIFINYFDKKIFIEIKLTFFFEFFFFKDMWILH